MSSRRNRPKSRVWQTTTFRLAVAFAAAFGVGTAVLLLALDLAVGEFAEETARDALRDQVAVLKADADLEGGDALIRSMASHVRGVEPERFRYLVVSPSGQRLDAGLPDSAIQRQGWGDLQLPTPIEEPGAEPFRVEIIYVTARANDGTMIAVGRDNYALEELREWLHRLAVWGGAALVIMAVLAGAFASMVFLQRLQRVSEAADRVVGGDLAERLPSLGFGREFDELADTLNSMLDRLEATVGALRQVSSDVAHDLRTPLTRLRNTLEDAQDKPDREELLSEALAETDRLLEIFAALLRLAQIEGSADRRLSRVDLSTLAADVVDAYGPAAEEAGRSLVAEIEPDAMMMGDQTMLTQVVANLIDNAITHSTGGSKVTVRVSSSDGAASLCVADDGSGAPTDQLDLLTRRFYRLDRSRKTPGTGLGLSMVAAIADYHGAALRIQNADPGLAVTLDFPPLSRG